MLDRVGAACQATFGVLGPTFMGFINSILDRTSFTVALFLLVTVPFAAHSIYDRLHNYAAATVQVSKVERVCYVDEQPGKRSDKPMPMAVCDALRLQAKKDGLIADLRIHESTVISFQYKSPADGEIHEGRLARNAGSKAPEVDAQIQVLLSRIDPTIVRE